MFEMPAPLANRFLHLDVQPDFDSFRGYALERGGHEQVRAGLSFRPALLHQLDTQRPAWPSPRSWEMAGRLHAGGLDPAPAVGEPVAAEFSAFLKVYTRLSGVVRILEGDGEKEAFPDEPSLRYALTVALSARARDAQQALHGFHWMVSRAPAEWVQLLMSGLFIQMRARGQMGALVVCLRENPEMGRFLRDYQQVLAE